MRILALLAALAAPVAAAGAPMTVHLLDYVAVDYAVAVEDGEVISELEYAEMRDFAAEITRQLDALPEVPATPDLRAAAAALAADIDARADPDAVNRRAVALRDAVIDAYDVPTRPDTPPDPALGARLYDTAGCAACHGAEGRGDGPAGAGLDPAPSDFHDAARMAQRSVHGLYNTITLGVDGTGMAAYTELSDDERWALAYHVKSFTATDPIATARLSLAESVAAYRAGDADRAVQLAIHAYLEGFELAEPRLASVDSDLLREVEAGFIDLRALLRAGAPEPEIESLAARLDASLQRAAERLDEDTTIGATFVASFLILLREGLEAILVIAAMLAVVTRAGRPEARRWIHVGWTGAIALGVATWFVSTHLIALSGANREITEGVTALLAAAILIYVGYWLHDKSRAAAWQSFIDQRLGVALGRGTLWTLASVSFLAAYREAFETVLFYQALAAHTGPAGNGALLGGFVVAAVALVAVAWIVLRTSVRLPLGVFFRWSGLLLIALAIVFAGHGAAALQEAGWLDVNRVAFVSLPALGVYATTQTLTAQFIALLLSIILIWRRTDVQK